MAVMTTEILTKIMVMTTTKIVLQLHRGVGSNTGLVDSVTDFLLHCWFTAFFVQPGRMACRKRKRSNSNDKRRLTLVVATAQNPRAERQGEQRDRHFSSRSAWRQ